MSPIGAVMSDIAQKMDKDYRSNSNIKWNFTKFLINREGNIVARFEPTDMKNIKEKTVIKYDCNISKILLFIFRFSKKATSTIAPIISPENSYTKASQVTAKIVSIIFLFIKHLFIPI